MITEIIAIITGIGIGTIIGILIVRFVLWPYWFKPDIERMMAIPGSKVPSTKQDKRKPPARLYTPFPKLKVRLQPPACLGTKDVCPILCGFTEDCMKKYADDNSPAEPTDTPTRDEYPDLYKKRFIGPGPETQESISAHPDKCHHLNQSCDKDEPLVCLDCGKEIVFLTKME